MNDFQKTLFDSSVKTYLNKDQQKTLYSAAWREQLAANRRVAAAKAQMKKEANEKLAKHKRVAAKWESGVNKAVNTVDSLTVDVLTGMTRNTQDVGANLLQGGTSFISSPVTLAAIAVGGIVLLKAM